MAVTTAITPEPNYAVEIAKMLEPRGIEVPGGFSITHERTGFSDLIWASVDGKEIARVTDIDLARSRSYTWIEILANRVEKALANRSARDAAASWKRARGLFAEEPPPFAVEIANAWKRICESPPPRTPVEDVMAEWTEKHGPGDYSQAKAAEEVKLRARMVVIIENQIRGLHRGFMTPGDLRLRIGDWSRYTHCIPADVLDPK
jgi:hypothetical protein